MCNHFDTEMKCLKQSLHDLGNEVIAMIEKTAFALRTLDIKCATEVMHKNDVINIEKVKIEEASIKLIARYQPSVADLRSLITLLKVKGEVVRIADFVTDIAERIFVVVGNEVVQSYKIDFSPILCDLQEMLHDALKSLIYYNPTLARMVMFDDDIVDRLDREVYRWSGCVPKKDSHLATYVNNVITIAHAIECIDDGINNICDAIIHLDTGAMIRQRHQKQGASEHHTLHNG